VWPRWSGPDATDTNEPYPGWPIVIHQEDNYGPHPLAYLDSLHVNGEQLVKVIDARTQELVYALRPVAGTFRPPVYDTSRTYQVIVE